MELFRVVCIISPETESPAPAIIAAKTRGILMFQIMRIFAGLPFFARASTVSEIDIFEDPTKRQINDIKTAATIKTIIAVILFLLLLLSSSHPSYG
jgi:hypothetical protein